MDQWREFKKQLTTGKTIDSKSTQLQVAIDGRKEDWEEFLKEQKRLKEEVDEEHAKAVGHLSIMYRDMKKDLAKFSHF